MLIDGLLEVIESYLPAKTAMKGDRIGLQIQSAKTEVYNILITLEITEDVIKEAVSQKIDCIITFHPLIYNPLTNIIENNRVGKLITKLIQYSIAVISVHTTFDAYINGTSKILSDMLGLNYKSFLIENDEISSSGLGVISYSHPPIKAVDLIQNLEKVCNSPIRYCIGKTDLIDKIGIIGGSGAEFIDIAIEKNCQAYICSDISYHKFHNAYGKIWLIEVGHYEMEQFVTKGLYELLYKTLKKNNIELIEISKTVTNPINYYPDNNYLLKQKEYLLKINS